MYLPSGLLVFLLVAAPWHVWVSAVNPEFPYFYFVQQHFLRYLTDAEQRYQPMLTMLNTWASEELLYNSQ